MVIKDEAPCLTDERMIINDDDGYFFHRERFIGPLRNSESIKDFIVIVE
jgi:hypothetical protein